jgi:hypothetical protein
VGGGSSKTSTGTESSPYAGLIAQFSKAFLPSAKAFGAQETEALKTGGVNAQIPIINRAVDASRGAESASNVQTQEALARAGLADTSFGAQIMGDQVMRGQQATASIPSSIAGQFVGAVPQTAGLGIGAATGAAAANSTTTFTESPWQQFFASMLAGQQAGAAFAPPPGGGSP